MLMVVLIVIHAKGAGEERDGWVRSGGVCVGMGCGGACVCVCVCVCV